MSCPAYACSKCVLEHTNDGHNVQSCSPSVLKMKERLEVYREEVQNAMVEAEQIPANSFDVHEERIKRKFDEEKERVERAFSAMIQKLRDKESEFIEMMRDQMEKELEQLKTRREAKKELERLTSRALDEIEEGERKQLLFIDGENFMKEKEK